MLITIASRQMHLQKSKFFYVQQFHKMRHPKYPREVCTRRNIIKNLPSSLCILNNFQLSLNIEFPKGGVRRGGGESFCDVTNHIHSEQKVFSMTSF